MCAHVLYMQVNQPSLLLFQVRWGHACMAAPSHRFRARASRSSSETGHSARCNNIFLIIQIFTGNVCLFAYFTYGIGAFNSIDFHELLLFIVWVSAVFTGSGSNDNSYDVIDIFYFFNILVLCQCLRGLGIFLSRKIVQGY